MKITEFEECGSRSLGCEMWHRTLVAIVMVTLVLVLTTRIAAADESGSKFAPVQISPEHRQLIGLQIATVREKDLAGKVETTGLVEPDEQLESYVQTRFSGWNPQVLGNPTDPFEKIG